MGSKFITLVNDVVPLGFEDVTVDIGWWKNGFPQGNRPMGKEPDANLDHWPDGMAHASAYAHQKGMSLSLYWSDNNDLSTEAGRIARTHAVERLFHEHHADVYRSDNVGGAVVGSGYARTAGFYQVLDDLHQRIPGFAWENCASGGTTKDYGAMSRALRIQVTDSYTALQSRQAFWCSSYAFPPIQLEGVVGGTNRTRRGSPTGIVFDFRSSSLGAAMIWFDSPSGINDQPWTPEEKQALTDAVHCYKTKIRPLVRQADLYHILPRPDGRHWDGIEYYDPKSENGMVAVFKPKSDVITQMIHFKGLAPARRYALTFEDSSHPPVEKSGDELMGTGLSMTLKDQEVSELVFFKSTSTPADSAVPTNP
jgi:alpha-galactosidase